MLYSKIPVQLPFCPERWRDNAHLKFGFRVNKFRKQDGLEHDKAKTYAVDGVFTVGYHFAK